MFVFCVNWSFDLRQLVCCISNRNDVSVYISVFKVTLEEPWRSSGNNPSRVPRHCFHSQPKQGPARPMFTNCESHRMHSNLSQDMYAYCAISLHTIYLYTLFSLILGYMIYLWFTRMKRCISLGSYYAFGGRHWPFTSWATPLPLQTTLYPPEDWRRLTLQCFLPNKPEKPAMNDHYETV